MAEVNIQTLAVTEVWVGATAVQHNLRDTLVNDLKVLGPGSGREINRTNKKVEENLL